MTNRALWVTMGTAHRAGELPNVEIWATRPKMNDDGTITGRMLASVCAKGFTRATGMSFQPGDCKKVRFSLVEVGHRSSSPEIIDPLL